MNRGDVCASVAQDRRDVGIKVEGRFRLCHGRTVPLVRVSSNCRSLTDGQGEGNHLRIGDMHVGRLRE